MNAAYIIFIILWLAISIYSVIIDNGMGFSAFFYIIGGSIIFFWWSGYLLKKISKESEIRAEAERPLLEAKEQAEREAQEKKETIQRIAIQRKVNERKQAVFRKYLVDKNKDLLDKFLEIAERKVSVIDDYGDENWAALPKEINTVLAKLAEREGLDLTKAEMKKYQKGGEYDLRFDQLTYSNFLEMPYEWWQLELEKCFREYYSDWIRRAKQTQYMPKEDLSGSEFEVWITKLLKDKGITDVRGTPASGDQGADLIVKINGKTIIIQAKKWKGNVGNKAVQEVIGAVKFYKGDEGWVITNSSFTKSAKELAQSANIKLIDLKMLEQIEKFL